MHELSRDFPSVGKQNTPWHSAGTRHNHFNYAIYYTISLYMCSRVRAFCSYLLIQYTYALTVWILVRDCRGSGGAAGIRGILCFRHSIFRSVARIRIVRCKIYQKKRVCVTSHYERVFMDGCASMIHAL